MSRSNRRRKTKGTATAGTQVPLVAPDVRPLALLRPGERGQIARVVRDLTGRAERLAALGVSAGAAIRVLQTFPGIVFECDQTELAVERAVARSILVEVGRPSVGRQSSRSRGPEEAL